jgi:pimeloyl-ACP methyl ester carboxylesterase
MLESFVDMRELLAALAPYADAIAATPDGRRRATELITVNYEHIPPALIAHLICGTAGCTEVRRFVAHARQASWDLGADRIDCSVRIVWGTEDRLLPWPASAARYRARLPHADWVVLDEVGHCPQLDIPLETAELIVGVSAD